MSECKNKFYIEKIAQEISFEKLKEDIRIGCLKCSGYEICVDNTEQEERLKEPPNRLERNL